MEIFGISNDFLGSGLKTITSDLVARCSSSLFNEDLAAQSVKIEGKDAFH